MMLVSRFHVLQHSIKLAWAHRKGPISALPEKAAIPSIKRFDPFRGCFLYLFDERRLGDSSWQRRDNVNVINNTAYTHKFSTEIAADCGQICMYAVARLIRAKARDSWC